MQQTKTGNLSSMSPMRNSHLIHSLRTLKYFGRVGKARWTSWHPSLSSMQEPQCWTRKKYTMRHVCPHSNDPAKLRMHRVRLTRTCSSKSHQQKAERTGSWVDPRSHGWNRCWFQINLDLNTAFINLFLSWVNVSLIQNEESPKAWNLRFRVPDYDCLFWFRHRWTSSWGSLH